ncbi:MAG: hypothetical protein GY711_02405 [bacterium]|nr:hypothetical protein [bacterium]
MLFELFSGSVRTALPIFCAFAFAFGTIVGAAKYEGRGTLLRGLEAAVLALVGAVLARLFLGAALWLDGFSAGSCLVAAWLFFPIAALVDLAASIGTEPSLGDPALLLWMATIVGAVGGALDGTYRIHAWRGRGWLTFGLDYTWGLTGSAHACLLHVINAFWGDHADEPARDQRQGVHRYRSGFRPMGGFVFTQGNTMSNCRDRYRSTGLFKHEQLHCWQSRVFGPVFILTYAAWAMLFFVPGAVAGKLTGGGVWRGIQWYSYYNNPWEVWAYTVGGYKPSGPEDLRLTWDRRIVGFWSMIFYGLFTVGMALPARRDSMTRSSRPSGTTSIGRKRRASR